MVRRAAVHRARRGLHDRVIYDPRVPNIEEPSLTVDGKPLKVEALDDYTVRMTMPRVFAPLLYSIGVPMVPAHLLETALEAGKFNHTWGINTPPQKIVGLGQFEMARYVQAQFVHFNRYPNYWMRDEKGERLPRLHGETLQIVPEATPSTCAFSPGRSTSTRRARRKSSISGTGRNNSGSRSRKSASIPARCSSLSTAIPDTTSTMA